MNADDKIRAILKMEADAVEPSPAGWDAIQQGVASRRARPWWTAGAALAGAAAVFLGATAYVAMNDGDRGVRGVPAPPAATGAQSASPQLLSPTPSPQPSVAPAAPARPIDAIWPLTTTAEVAEWEADPSSLPALRTARGVALAFARRYLLLDDARIVGPESFGVSELVVNDGRSAVTTLTVKGFGKDGTAPFAVIHAESRKLRVSSPAPGALVPTTFEARGTYEESDPDLRVELLADGSGAARSAAAFETFPDVDPPEWHAQLSLDLAKSPRRTGTVLVTLRSGPDGRVTSAAAVPVALRTGLPEAMVAARDGRIAVLSTATGKVVRWLTEPSRFGAAQPELSDDGKTVVYVQATGDCAAEIRSVPVAGGEPTTLVAEKTSLRHPSRRGDVLAYVRDHCPIRSDLGEDEVVVRSGSRVVGTWPAAEVDTGPVVGERFVVFATMSDEGSRLHAVDGVGELGETTVEAPESGRWAGLAWGPRDADGREQLFAALDLGVDPGGVLLYRFAADLRQQQRLAELHTPRADYLDYAGDHLVIGAVDAAWIVQPGWPRKVPGAAQRPTWS